MNRWTQILSAALLFCIAAPAVAELPPLIARDILFGNPEKSSPQLSPDGKQLAYVAPDDKNVQQVWLRTVGQDDDRVITADPKRGIRVYFWTYLPDTLVYAQDVGGDENYHLFSVNVKSKESRDLTPHKGVRAMPIDSSPRVPDEILVGMNLKTKSKFDVYRINLKTGESKLDTENPGTVMGWVADPNFKIRAATAINMQDGGREIMVRESPEQPFKIIRKLSAEDEGAAVGFAADGQTLYITANHDNDTIRLIAHDLATGKEQVLAEDKQYDIGGVMQHPTKYTVQAVAINRDKVDWKVLDPNVADDFEAIGKIRRGQFGVASRDLEDKTWLIAYTTDDGPIYYYTYDRATKDAKLLFTHQPKLEGLQLASMKPISYKSRDNLTIHGYLTVPVGIDAKNLPTVLDVHGGPWGRDAWGFNPTHQWLANRGYAVLSVNFRGSTGYGKRFMNAGNREWAGKMHDDLIDGVEWLIKQGVADRKKVAIMGGSYGGYATLVGLTFTPDVFCCGVDIVGPSNIVTLLKSVPPYWAPMKKLFDTRVGVLGKEDDFLKSRSPLFHIDRIKAPLLIGQGANDPRVKQAESDQIVAAMRKANKPVEYVLYPDEGHGFQRPENRMHFYAVSEVFLAKHLGGRAEPVGEIKGHSGVIK